MRTWLCIIGIMALLWLAENESAVAQTLQGPPTTPRIWYVEAGASGGGLDASSPFGSTEEVESASGPGDIILLLPTTAPLEGGLALKPRQILRGILDGARHPAITNSGANRNGGAGLVLAAGVRVEGIEIRDTHASGIFGLDVDNVAVADVLVRNTNTGRLLLDGLPFPRPLPHAGITLLNLREGVSTNVELSGVRVLEAAGIGISALAVTDSDITLHILNAEVRGGLEIGSADYGVMAYAAGSSSSVSLEIIRSAVSGRMSRNGRNIVLLASNHGTVRGLIDASIVGESGQDGVIASLDTLPASAELMIIGSIIENAAQSNVEGTMYAGVYDEAAVRASRMEVSIHRSTIRGAASLPGFDQFRDRAANVNMTGSFNARGDPLVRGRYVLRITDSQIVSSRVFGLRVGTPDTQPTVDPGDFDILVRGTRFEGNERADVLFGASDARVDARRNCWLSPSGEEGARVVTFRVDTAEPIDAAQPMPCSR